MNANINFKSNYHKLARSELKTYFAAFAIQDIKEQQEEEGSEQGEESPHSPWPPLREVLGAGSTAQPSNLPLASSSSEDLANPLPPVHEPHPTPQHQERQGLQGGVQEETSTVHSYLLLPNAPTELSWHSS